MIILSSEYPQHVVLQKLTPREGISDRPASFLPERLSANSSVCTLGRSPSVLAASALRYGFHLTDQIILGTTARAICFTESGRGTAPGRGMVHTTRLNPRYH